MKSQSKSMNVLSALFLIGCVFLVGPKFINAQEVDDESEFDYYNDSEKGPNKWGQIRPEWASCNNGTIQSPIDLAHARAVTIYNLSSKRNYTTGDANVTNRGHDIQIQWRLGESGSVSIHGNLYYLLSAHWHTPSEHTVNGTRYAMELHMVHLCTDLKVKNKIAVLGVLYKTGRPDSFLSKLMPNISWIKDHTHRAKLLRAVDPNEINIDGKEVHRYVGSLTVPPCTEGVIWTINKKVMTVSSGQVNFLRDVVHDYAARNARPLQAKHRRAIYLYKPERTTERAR